MEDFYTSGKNHIAPPREASAELISFVDDAVQKKFEDGVEVIDIIPHGESLWGRTAKLDTIHPDGRKVPYFLKVHVGPEKEGLMSSEYHAMTIMHDAMPELAPKPVAYGCYDSQKDVWFFLSEFRDMHDKLPDVEEFCQQISLLHQHAVNPEGKFGWPWPVYAGKNPRMFPLSESWEETFTLGLLATFELEERMQGPDEELALYKAVLFEKLIPRLLRPLQADGRSIQPTIIHGDLWHGNIAVDIKTGSPIIFDPCAMWAHHELELGPWACPRHRVGEQYIHEYRKLHPIVSAPEEDFDNRMLLYSINFDVQSSSNYPGNLVRRGFVKDTIRKLVDRCGLEDWIFLRAKKLLIMQGLDEHDDKDVEENDDDDNGSVASTVSAVTFNEILSANEAVDHQWPKSGPR